MFHQVEGRGRARYWRGRPEQFDELHEGGARKHHEEDEGPAPQFGPGPGGGPYGYGRAHGPSGRGRFGWIPRDFMFGRGRGPMVRRGDVRAAILVLLAEEPMHGYQIIQQLGERSGGMWRPSAGSVYPTLQQLEDEGMVKGEDREGRTVYSLTDAGRKAATEAAKSPAPWDMPGSTEAIRLYDLFLPLGAAVAQVSAVGSPETLKEARAILIEARRSLYRLLAEDENPGSPPAEK